MESEANSLKLKLNVLQSQLLEVQQEKADLEVLLENASHHSDVMMAELSLAGCIPAFGDAQVVHPAVVRIFQGVSHFAPGSYRYLLSGTTSLSNVFMSGDWVVTRHGSWSQEKAYVTGLEAANRVMSLLGAGTAAEIIPIVPDEPHIQVARMINKTLRQLVNQVMP